MDTPDDESLQELLENSLREGADAKASSYNQEDVAAYAELFKLLNDKPTVTLPVNFSTLVVADLQARRDCLFDFRWNFILPVVFLLLLGIAYCVCLYSGSAFANQLIRLFERFKWYFVFATVCFFFVQYFDHRFWARSTVGSYKYV